MHACAIAAPMRKVADMVRQSFAPTAAETDAIDKAQRQWIDLCERLPDLPPDDPSCLTDLRAVSGDLIKVLDRFVRAPHAGHMATLVGALQAQDLPVRPQAVQRKRIDALYETLLDVRRACELVAPPKGAKQDRLEALFIRLAAQAWQEGVGRPPTSKGRFMKALAACVTVRGLEDITADRVQTVLTQLRAKRAGITPP